MYNKITFLPLKKIEKKLSLEVFWYFSCFIFYFLIEKLLARVPHAPASRQHLHHPSSPWMRSHALFHIMGRV
jgi:hypothetical protein